jgi:hypothetical protein
VWVITTDDKHALYNLDAFEAVVAIQDAEKGAWSVVAQDSQGSGRVVLATTQSQEEADNLIRHIADRSGALDLGREARGYE